MPSENKWLVVKYISKRLHLLYNILFHFKYTNVIYCQVLRSQFYIGYIHIQDRETNLITTL